MSFSARFKKRQSAGQVKGLPKKFSRREKFFEQCISPLDVAKLPLQWEPRERQKHAGSATSGAGTRVRSTAD